MVVTAYGVPGLSILELSLLLNNLDVTYGVVINNNFQAVKRNATLPVAPVIFDSPQTFIRTRFKFKSKRINALILGDPYTLSKEYALPLVGARLEKSSCVFVQFGEQELKEMLILDHGDSPVTVERKALYDPVSEVLKSYNASPLSSLQTQLYRISDTDTRKKVNLLVKTYFVSRESMNVLRRKLSKVASEKVVDTFTNMLATPEMKKLRLAVQKAKASPNKLKTIAKRLKISPFDIKYLIVTKETSNAPARK